MGDSPTSTVCFYINRKLSHLSPVLKNIIGLSNNNILLLDLTMEDRGRHIRILNIYNYPKTMDTAHAIIDNEDMLLQLNLCMEDFNIYHLFWNVPGLDNRPSKIAQDFIYTLQG
jgi:hypothetical protein